MNSHFLDTDTVQSKTQTQTKTQTQLVPSFCHVYIFKETIPSKEKLKITFVANDRISGQFYLLKNSKRNFVGFAYIIVN